MKGRTKRMNWTRTTKRGTGAIWQHTSGHQVKHCGHPTALYPYYGLSTAGEVLLAPNGYAFRHLIDAQMAVEKKWAVPA